MGYRVSMGTESVVWDTESVWGRESILLMIPLIYPGSFPRISLPHGTV